MSEIVTMRTTQMEIEGLGRITLQVEFLSPKVDDDWERGPDAMVVKRIDYLIAERQER